MFVVLGDGECDEGSVWKAALVAGAHGLDNLVAIVDRNAYQANLATEALIPLEPFAPKWEAFGRRTILAEDAIAERAWGEGDRSPGRARPRDRNDRPWP